MGQLGGSRQTARRRITSVPLFAVECRGLPSQVGAGRRTIRVPGSRQATPYQESAMGEPSSVPPPSGSPPEDRLDSWKEIAAYLNRDVTTVQRWEKREGMPVHRHLHDRMGSVFASRAELDRWARGRNLRAATESLNNTSSPYPTAQLPHPAISISPTTWRFVLVLAAAGVAVAIGAGLWFERTEY